MYYSWGVEVWEVDKGLLIIEGFSVGEFMINFVLLDYFGGSLGE